MSVITQLSNQIFQTMGPGAGALSLRPREEPYRKVIIFVLIRVDVSSFSLEKHSFRTYFGLVRPRDLSQNIPIWTPTKFHQISTCPSHFMALFVSCPPNVDASYQFHIIFPGRTVDFQQQSATEITCW